MTFFFGVQHRLGRGLLLCCLGPQEWCQWSKSSDDCIRELQWPSLQSRRNFLSLSMLYDIWKGRTGINFNNYFQFNELSTRSHSLTLKLFSTTINVFRHSFFVSVAFLWNTIPEDILLQKRVKIFKSKLKQFLL